MRQNSIDAFHAIRGDGTLNKLQFKVLLALFKSELVKDAEAPTARELIANHGAPDGAWKRMSEMVRAGYIIQAGTRKCAITKRNASTWRINRRIQGELDFAEEERTD